VERRIKYDALVNSWMERLIEGGTGLTLTVEGAPLHAFEARRISWEQGRTTIEVLERIQAAPFLLLRFGFLRLTEISLVDHRQNWRPQAPADIAWRRLSDRGRFLALQGWHEASAPRPAQSRPNRGDVLKVLSALLWFLDEVDWRLPRNKIGKQRRNDLAKLVAQVFPPLFVLISKKERDLGRLLSEIISKHREPLEPRLTKDQTKELRRQAGKADYEWLMSEMERTDPPLTP
jgi:hypothetical protein